MLKRELRCFDSDKLLAHAQNALLLATFLEQISL